MRRAARRDTAEKAIADALRAVGCDVTFISGKGAPDILVARGDKRRLWAFEVKTGKGKRTQAQEQSQWPIVRTVDEALAAIGVRARVQRLQCLDGTVAIQVKYDEREV